MMLKSIFDQWKTEMQSKGCGGIVSLFDNYQNDLGTASPTQKTKSIETIYTASKNESPAISPILHGGASSPLTEVIN